MMRSRFASLRRRVLVVIAALAAQACAIDDPSFTGLVDAGGLDAALDTPLGEVHLMASAPSVTVPEQGTATFTVVLTAPPPDDVLVNPRSSDVDVVTVTSGAILFDPSSWSTPQVVTLAGRADVDVVDATAMIDLVPTTTAIAAVAIDVVVSDDDGLGIVAAPATLDVTEGGNASVTIRLSAQPPGPITVDVSSSDLGAITVEPATLTFTTATWHLDQTAIVTGLDDPDTTNAVATIDLTSPSLVDVGVAVTVIDDDVLGISPSTTNLGALPEGGAGSFTVRLSQQPPGDLVVAVASSELAVATTAPATLTFTTTTWMTPQPVSIALPDDADLANEIATVTLSAPGVTSRTVALAVVDDDRQAIVTAPLGLALDEGGTRALGVHLAFQPTADRTLTVSSLDPAVATVTPTTLTFTPASYATDQVITVAAPHDADAAAGATAVRVESAADGLTTDVPVAVTDDDLLLIEASAPAVSLGEASSATFGVRLSAMPLAAVVVAVGSGDASAATVAPATLTFSPTSWSTLQTVTVSGVADLDLAAESVTITLSSSGLPARTVSAAVVDDDAQVIVATPTIVSVNEGGTSTVGVRLGFQPASNVTVTITSADPGAATSAPTTRTFTPANYGIDQLITISGVDDADPLDDSTTLTASAPGAISATVAVTVNDNDALGIETSVTTLTIGEAGTGTVGVRLTAQPAATTTVTVASSDPGAATVAPASLTFTTASWNLQQNATVSGVADADASNESVTISAASPGLTTRTVTVSVTDDETQTIVTSLASLAVAEGGTATFTVRLAEQPLATTTVTVGSSDTSAATAAPGILTFTTTSYATPQVVTVGGEADGDLANEAVTITLSSSGLPTKTVAVTVTDDDPQVIVVSPTTVNLTEGGSGTFTVALGFAPIATTTVAVTTSNALTANPTPTTLTFTTASYATAQTVTVAAPHDTDAVANSATITASATGAISGAVTVNVTDDDTLGIETSVSALTVAEASTATFGVRLTAQPTLFSGTVSIASSDLGAATRTPTSLTFTSATWSTFQYVTAAGVADADAANETVTMTLTASGLAPRTVSVTVTDDDIAPGNACNPASSSFVCVAGYACAGTAGAETCVVARCNDAVDADGDGFPGFPTDPGCATPSDHDETDACPSGPGCPACGDGVDNDGDTRVDYPLDLGCNAASTTSELECQVETDPIVAVTAPATMGTTVGAANDLRPTCGSASTFTAPERVHILNVRVPLATLHVDTAPTGFDNTLTLSDATCGPTLACVDNPVIDRTDVVPGAYTIIVDGYAAAAGTYTLNVRGTIANGGACNDPLVAAGVWSCTPGFGCTGPAGSETCRAVACNDAVDGDGDGQVGYPTDPGCTSPSDVDETDDCPSGPGCPACGDDLDNDSDGTIDYPMDLGCASAASPTELGCAGETDPITIITAPVTSGTTVGATNNFTPTCQTNSNLDRGHILSLAVPLASLTIDTEGSTGLSDTILMFMTATCSLPPIACDDDGGTNNLSTITRTNVAAGTYAIEVDGYGAGSGGAYLLNVRGTIAAGSSCNDPLVAAGVLTCAVGTTCQANLCAP